MSTEIPSPEDESDAGALRADGRKRKRHQKKSYGKTAKVGAVWSMLRQGGNEIIGIPLSMVLARLLSPYDFGVAAMSSFFIHLAARVTQLGFGAALVRVKEMRPEHTSSVYAVNQGLGILTFTILYVLAPFMGRFFRSPEAGNVLQLAAVAFLITPLGVVPAALFQRRMQFRYTVMSDWIDTAIGAVVTVVFALKGYAYWSPVIGHLTALVFRIILQIYLSAWRPSLTLSRPALRELFGFGLGVQTKRLLEYTSSNLDNLVVGRLLGMTALGIYSKAFNTMSKIVFRLTLGHAPFRIFSLIHEDKPRFARAYSRLIMSITLLGYPVLVGCIVVAEPLFLLLFGEKWLPAVPPFQLLCAGGMLKLLNNYSWQANEAVGNIWPQVRRQAVGAVLVLGGSIVGSIYGGVVGVAIGVLVAWMILTMSLLTLVRQATGLSWSDMLAPHMPAVTCAGLLAVVLAATAAAIRAVVIEPAAWQMLLAQATTGGLFYLAFVLLCPFDAVREIVGETADDLLPSGPARLFNRFLRPVSKQQA